MVKRSIGVLGHLNIFSRSYGVKLGMNLVRITNPMMAVTKMPRSMYFLLSSFPSSFSNFLSSIYAILIQIRVCKLSS